MKLLVMFLFSSLVIAFGAILHRNLKAVKKLKNNKKK